MDVCYRVIKCFDAGNRLKLKVEVINQGFVESYRLGIDLKFEVLKSDLRNWLICNEPMATCLRYVEWRKV